jgi:virginiamycin B lyase
VSRWPRDEVVEARADAILADARTARAYAEHFEAQMRGTVRKLRGTVRKLLARMRVLRHPGVALAAASLIPLAVLGFAVLGPYQAPARLSGLNGVDALRAASGRLVAVSSLPGPPGAVSAADGSVWVADPGAGEVARIDPGTDAATARVPVDGQPGAIASGGGAIWVADTSGAVTRIDPATNSVTQMITLPWGHPGAMAFGAGRVWVADPAARQLAEINPVTGSLARTLSVNLQPSAIAAVGPAIWVAGNDSPTVEELAAASGRVLARVRVGAGPSALAVGAGSLWVASSVEATISRIDLATSAVTAVIPVGRGPAVLVAGPGSVWVADQDSGAIYRIDPRTDQVTASTSVMGAPTSLAISGGLIYAGTRRTATPVSRDATSLPRLCRPMKTLAASGRCEQAQGAGLPHGLGPAARAELLVQVPLVRLDGVHRQVQLAGDLPRGQVARQVVQHPRLAVGKALGAARRLRAVWVGRPVPGHEDRTRVGRVTDDYPEQERRHHPDPVVPRDLVGGQGQVRGSPRRGITDHCCHVIEPSSTSRLALGVARRAREGP